MFSLRRRTFLGAVGALLAAPAVLRAAQSIKIGGVFSTTGPASWLGDPEEKTLRMYVDRLNAAGGIAGRQVEVFIYDDGSEAAKANSFAKRLIQQDGVDVMIGPSTTGSTMAIVPLAQASGVPMISCGAANVIVQPITPFVFKMPHSDTLAAEAVLGDMKKRGISKFALLSDSGGFGKSGRVETQKAAAKLGLTIVSDEAFGERDTDMTPVLTKVKGTDAQAVFMFGTGQAPAIIARNYKQIQMQPPLYTTHSQASYEFIKIAGDAAEGLRLPTPALLLAETLSANDPQKAVVTDYKKAWEEKYHSDVSTFGGYAFDALMLAAAAIKQAGSSERAKLRDAIEQTKGFVGVSGIYNFSAEDHAGLDSSALRMVEIKGGKFVAVG